MKLSPRQSRAKAMMKSPVNKALTNFTNNVKAIPSAIKKTMFPSSIKPIKRGKVVRKSFI